MNKIRIFFTILIFLFGLSFSLFAQGVSGHVKNSSGKPLEKVVVQPLGRIFGAVTNADGFYEVPFKIKGLKDGKDYELVYSRKDIILVFDKIGYRPKVVNLDEAVSNLDVTLEKETSDETLIVQSCVDDTDKNIRSVGKYLRLSVPKKLKFKTGVDTDYIYYSIGFGEGKNKFWLNGGLGNLYGSPYPPSFTLGASKEYSFRTIIFAEKQGKIGLDWRGVTNDGVYWRWIGSAALFDAYHYETKSKEAAEFFDKILDNLCLQN
jgi:hypothetical protein